MVAPSRSAPGSWRRRPREGSVPQAVTVLLGVAFTLIGALGFLATGFDGFADYAPGERLFGLALNPLQNTAHLAVGMLGIALSSRRLPARSYGWLVAAGLGALFGFGLVAVRRPELNVFNLNWADNWLHLAAALAGLAAALAPAKILLRRRSPARRPAGEPGR